MNIKLTWTLLDDYATILYLVAYLNDCGDECMTLKKGRLKWGDLENFVVTCKKHNFEHKAVVLGHVFRRHANEDNEDLSEAKKRYYDYAINGDQYFTDKKWNGWTLKEATEHLLKINEDFFKKCLKIKK